MFFLGAVPPCPGLLAIAPAAGSVLFILILFALIALMLVWITRPLTIVRPVLWVIAQTIYRLRVTGQENIPRTGPILFVCNHVSYIDWFLLIAAQPRFVRFLVWAPYARAWGVRHILRWGRVIPVDGAMGPRAIVAALRSAGDALAQGEVVCIFAEGALTKTGFMLPFHRGFEQVLKRTPVPIVPVCLDHMWGSIFSYHGGKVLGKWPQEVPYPVSVAFGKPLPPNSSAAEVRLTIQKLSADVASDNADRRLALHRRFVRTAVWHPFRTCLGDSSTPKFFRYFEILAAAIVLSGKLRPVLGSEPMVGVWLPPSIGAALSNIVLAFLGKTSVNLNYTAGADSIRSAIRQCNIRHIITSHRFIERVKLDAGPDVQLLYLEDLRNSIPNWRRWVAAAWPLILPWRLTDYILFGGKAPAPHDPVTIIFSSGSTGEPKGVVLSYRNIGANADSSIQALNIVKTDRILGVLPLFHSFGYTVCLWVPSQVGGSTYFHPDPRQAKEIGEICRKQQATGMVATATFLRFYLRRCEPDDFKSVRLLVCGAEKLPASLAAEFQKKFSVLPLEGYGTTELSPVVSCNVPDQVVGETRQVGNKPGTIGQPIPGVAARVVNPDTMEPLPFGAEGLLTIYGPNVMEGYLGKPELTNTVIRDGWYNTGDIAKIDEDGFITITGRLARFAKVGGEMIPLEKIEEELNHLLESHDRLCAVTAVPDDKRGERLVVLHLRLDGKNVPYLVEGLSKRGLPNLWVPGERDFIEVPEIPILGSGKLDLKRVKEIALEKTGTKR
jgi:acyl-[acyl-carrier-protein]-phospholipid O-acyltransferase/long-chain-fatty-acid--[acyl-carrier-protein] ligase